MADIDTKFIRKIVIESDNGKAMDKLDFTLDFFVYTNRVHTLTKNELIRVVNNGESSYYALIDSQKLGRGNVMCRARIIDVEPRLDGMSRPVVLTRNTGIVISPNCQCGNIYDKHECFEEGYKISFEEVYDIPKQDAQGVLYGVITQNINSYGEITEQMAYNLVAAESLSEQAVSVNVGDKIVILVNSDNTNHAYKDNGNGELVAFDESILGSNGDYTLNVEGTAYRVYGEMALVSGNVYVTVNR